MVYVRKPDTLEAFTQSAWVDTPARMLAPLLVHSLERSGQFRAVVQAPSSAKVQLRLDTTIVRLQQNFLQSPSQLRFSVHATLIDNNSREVLAWRAFDVIEETSSDDASGGAAATRTAVQVALQALVRWLEPLSRQPGAID
jgi:cholesterol transport system auxiliary component